MLIAALALPGGADAAVSFKAENGWELSFDGFVNAFAVDEIGSEPPAGLSDPLLNSTDENAFRVRTGLLPGLFAFNVAAPPVEGLTMKARVGFYPQVNNANTRNDFEPQIDLRELFFTVDGGFGQVLVGKAINLYQGKNILTDMTLFGVGTQGGVSGNGTTLGRIGYGYLYSQFGAQMRYTTPSFSGLKLAAAVVDPSRLGGATTATGTAVPASETRYPGFEGELSYAGDYGATKVQAWVSGLQQKAWFPATAGLRAGDDVTALGWAAGLGVNFGGLDLLGSAFGGQALGTVLLLDADALDATGDERDSIGFLAQAAYTLAGRTKLGVSYGQTQVDETDAESALPGGNGIETRSSWTGGIYHDINKNLKVVAEYTRAMTDWFGGEDQSTDVIALGGFFIW